MKYLQNEARKQKSVEEVTPLAQFSMIFQIRLKITPSIFESYALYEDFMDTSLVELHVERFLHVDGNFDEILYTCCRPDR
jgi:hypothetical protein